MKEYIVTALNEETEQAFKDAGMQELVRCEYCTKWNTMACALYTEDWPMAQLPPDWFCAEGERE